MKPLEELTLGELLPVEYNPRRITERQADALLDTIDKYGFLQPLVLNALEGRERRIVGGEQRWRQLTRMHGPDAKIPPVVTLNDAGEQEERPGAVFVHLPLDREKELNVRLNRVGGEWDWDKLEHEYEREELLDWGFEYHDFHVKAPDDLPLEDPAPAAEPSASPEPAAAPAPSWSAPWLMRLPPLASHVADRTLRSISVIDSSSWPPAVTSRSAAVNAPASAGSSPCTRPPCCSACWYSATG